MRIKPVHIQFDVLSIAVERMGGGEENGPGQPLTGLIVAAMGVNRSLVSRAASLGMNDDNGVCKEEDLTVAPPLPSAPRRCSSKVGCGPWWSTNTNGFEWDD